MTNTVAKHLEAINAGTITKTNVIGLRKIFNHVARLDYGLSGNRSNATIADADKLFSAIYKHKPRVAGELHDSGLALLNNKRYAKQLAQVSHLLPLVSGFRLVDFEYFDRLHCVPIFEARDNESLYSGHDAALFQFRNIPWQSGGNGPEIVTE